MATPLTELGNPLCTRCKLHETAKTICVMGNGSLSSRVIIVGEAPGQNEDEGGEPFVGQAGNLLDEALADASLPRESVYVTNVVKCRPPKNRRPEPDEKVACALYLGREVAAIQPLGVLLLGNTPLHALTFALGGITTERGRLTVETIFDPETLVWATFHPAYILRNRSLKPDFKEDIVHFANLLRGSYMQTSQADPLKVTSES